MTDYGFIRVSTGSQDSLTQERDILARYPGAVIIRPGGRAASASKGQQLDALDGVIAKLRKGDRVIVTDSSRLDRRDNLTSQVETMLAIRGTGAIIVSLAPGETRFANGDDLGSWVTTLVTQNANAEKSRTVKAQTHRGVKAIFENRGWFGPLPMLWTSHGDTYRKQAVCTDPEAVKAIYESVANGTSMQSIARRYGVWGTTIKKLLRFEGNKGEATCRYTYNPGRDGELSYEWTHETAAPVSAALWQQVQDVLKANEDRETRKNRGGNPNYQAKSWLSGVLDCPVCGGGLFTNQGKNRNGTARTVMLRCVGKKNERVACRRFPNQVAQVIQDEIDALFSDDPTPLLRFDRIAGNAHVKAAMEADLDKLSASLGSVRDRAERRAVMAKIEEMEDSIESFELIPDSFDYTPTGETLASAWVKGDVEAKRAMLRAVKDAGGIGLVNVEGRWTVRASYAPEGEEGGIIDLGGGICFRKRTGSLIRMLIEGDGRFPA
jgi:DNA invertase Pin-like site-specific DNA recombinase